MRLVKGALRRHGKVAYVAQQVRSASRCGQGGEGLLLSVFFFVLS